MTLHRVFLSLGSNLGDRKRNLVQAVACLQRFLEQISVSSLYETSPLEFVNQPLFLNIVVRGLTRLGPLSLLDRVLAIEKRFGRDRSASPPKGPRTIDIDVLLFDDRLIDASRLRVPHPRLTVRRFVLQPLLELDPELRHPATGEPLARSLERLGDQGVYILGPWEYTLAVPDHDCGRPGRETKL